MPKGKAGNPNQAPFDFMVPSSEWVAPKELPDLVAWGVRRVSRDLETRDDGIAAARGAGWATGAGYVAGVAVGWAGGSVYVPLRHPETDCFDPATVARWLSDMDRAGVEVIFQGGSYDIGWSGVPIAAGGLGLGPPPKMQDTHAAAVMLDENRLSYKLDALCAWQGLPGKDYALLLEAGAALGCGRSINEVMGNLWRMPARFVGPYGEGDGRSTLDLWDRLEPQLKRDEVWEAYQTEVEIMPLCVEMRRRGIRIDTGRAEQSRAELRVARDTALKEVGTYYREGREPEIGDVLSPIWLGRAFAAAGLPYPQTPKSGQGSFQSDWLDTHAHPLARAVGTARYMQMIEDKFIRGFLLDYCHRGRVHAEVNQLRDDEGGTRTYRFSYSDPPLQQMPSSKRAPPGASEFVKKRNMGAGKLIRSCFLPEVGEQWASADYSQQEYKLMVHFASLLRLPKADMAVEQYTNNPATDFHALVAELTGLPRPEAKDVNFAQSYGAGVDKFAIMTNRSKAEAVRIREQYDEQMPFIKLLSDRCKKAANKRGYVRLLDGAKCRFDRFEPGWGYTGPYHAPCSHEEARRRVEPGSGHDWEGAKIRRSFTHKAMNSLIQGSAARQTKIAMRDLWRQGIVPMLQMHDEINVSGSKETGIIVQRTMEQAVKLTIPVKADLGVGPSWGELA